MTKKIQNIYDNQAFFEGYKELRKNNDGFNASLEQPAICSLLPDLKDVKILDIGCGFGDFSRYAIKQGAASVLGIDPSYNMIQEAKKLTHESSIIFQQLGIENFESKPDTFDLVVSSLAFHYVEDFQDIASKISSWLKPGGYLVFSVEHPICTSYPDGIIKIDEHGRNFHPVYNYRDEASFTQEWLVEGVQKFHRKVSTYVNTLIECDFKIDKILEPQPSDEIIAQKPKFAIHKIRPPLLMIKAHI